MSQMNVKEIWRYPVKSMRGERLSTARLGARGVAGDRIWVVRGEKGEILPDRKNALSGLLNCSARYDETRDEVEITLPDGRVLHLREGVEAEVATALSPVVGGRAITLRRTDRTAPATPVASADRETVASVLKRFCKPRTDDPPFPDVGRYPEAALTGTMDYVQMYLRRNEVPPQHGFDLFPVNILTEASLRWMSRRLGKPADVRRFRPNFVIADAANAAERVEFAWEGKEVALGDGGAAILCVIRCERCVMPTLPQSGPGVDLPGDGAFGPQNESGAAYLSNYALVAREGVVVVGDALKVS